MPIGDFQRLAAMLDETKDLKQPLEMEIRGAGRDLILAVTRGRHDTLTTVPFNPMCPDASARHVARKLVLDGDLPHRLD